MTGATSATGMLAVRCVTGSFITGAPMTTMNGTVVDTLSGLEWDPSPRIAAAWTSIFGSCAADSLAGFTDWRVPTAKELASIVNDVGQNTALPLGFNAPSTSDVWSSTPSSLDPTMAFAVSVGTTGDVTTGATTSTLATYCVRGQ